MQEIFGRWQMSIFSGLKEIVKQDYNVGEQTWYKTGGTCEFYISPKNTDQLSQVVKICKDNTLKLHILGRGSNVLVADEGIKGVVVSLDADEFSKFEYQKDLVKAGAGAKLSELVLQCAEKGLSGLESLAGIPGSIGGAVRMNAGGGFGDIGAVVEKVILMDTAGNVYEKCKPELVFDYRKSNITAPIILQAEIILQPGDSLLIAKTMKEIWIYKKNSQPLGVRNSGCVFKNPRGVSAGALIDRAGLKGHKIGQATVSEKHANFIIAEDDCTSNDILKLVDHIKDTVKQNFDIELETEIEIWK